jgi:TP901 family phage tail tape measure protein
MTTQQETAVLSVFLNGEQAKNEISDLEKKAEGLKNRINQVGKNSEIGKRLSRELTETRNNIKALQSDVVNVDKVLKNLSAAKPKELSATLTALKRQLHFSGIERGSKEWNRLQENIRKVREEMRSISAESAVAESRMSRMSNGFNKYFGIIASGVATITGVSFTFRKLAQDIAHLDDVYSDVMKTTGMTHEQVEDLNEAFKEMDTRTSREELNNLARDAGKLGLTAKKDILDFVEAGNQINVALGEDLGDGAIKSIGKIINVFEKSTKDLEGMDLKGKMLAVGSAINELGSSSTASEEFLVSFTGRMGGIATQAGITVDQVLGYASGLDQNMQSLELSATALQQFIMKIMGNPAKFAKIAGMEVKQFSDLLKTDMNGALIAVLKSLQGKGGLQQLIPIFKDMGLDGARASQVLSALAGNVQQIEEAQRIANQALVEGTSLTKEYGVKNENLQAKLEKAKKEFNESALALGAHLNPVLLKSTNATTYLIKLLPAVIDWFSKYGKIIVNTAIAIGGYSLAMNASVIADKLKVFWINTVAASLKKLWVTMLNNPFGVVIAAATLLFSLYKSLNKELSVSEQRQKALNDVNLTAKKSIAEQTSELKLLFSVAKNEAISKEERLKAIKKLNEISPEYLGNLSLENINTQAATTAVKTYTEELLKNAKAKAIADRITELEAKKIKNLEEIAKLEERNRKRSSSDANPGSLLSEIRTDYKINARKKENEEIDRQQKLYAGLNAELFKTNDLKKEATGIIPGVEEKRLASLKQEKGELEQLKLKQIEIEKSRKNGKWEADVFTFVDQNQLNLIDAEIEKVQQLLDLLHTKPAGGNPDDPTPLTGGDDDALKEKLKTLDKEAALRRIAAMQAYKDQKSFEEELLKIERETVQKKQALYKEGSEEYVKYQEELQKFDFKVAQDKEKTELKRQEAIKALIEKYNKEAAQTDEQKKQLELKALNELFSEELRMTEQYLLLKQSIEDKYDPAKKKLRKSVDDIITDNKRFEKKATKKAPQSFAEMDEEKEALEKSKEAELAIIDAAELANLDSEIDYQEQRQIILDKYNALELEKDKEKQNAKLAIVQFGLEQMSTLLSAYSSYVQASQQAEEAAVESKYKKQIKAAGKNSKQVEKLEEEKEAELAKIHAEYEDKSFAIQVAQALASTAMAAINAYASTCAIVPIGPALAPFAAGVAVAAGMLQVATIKKQHDAAKANYYTGGYTPNGPWDKPQGVVHSEEFVGNRHAVRNPAIRKIFDVVKEAQDNNTVSSLTAKDFARALDYREAENRHLISGISSAVSPSGSDRGNETQILELIAGWLNRNAEVTDRLNKRLDEPFVGEVSITGRKGIKENLDRYEKMTKNASR